MEYPKSSSYARYLAVFLAFLAIGFVIYSNTMHSPFIFDDHDGIEFNGRLTRLSNFIVPAGARYFTNLTFAVNYAAGGLDTFGYHLISVLIHVANAFLVFLLVEFTIDRQKEGFAAGLGAGLLFLAHPAATGAVSYLSQRHAILATLLYLSAAVFYIKYRRAERGGAAFYMASLVCAVLAQKSKEISFTLAAVLVIYEYTFLSRDNADFRKRLAGLFPFMLTMAIVPLSRLTTRIPEGSIASSGLDMVFREDLALLPRYDYLVTQFRVIVTYLRLLVLPMGQNLDYDYPQFHSILVPEVLLSFLFLLSILIASALLYLYSRAKDDVRLKIVSFGVIWFFVTISIESSVIPISDVIFEHRLYLPSVGLFAAFSAGLGRLLGPRRRVFYAAAVILAVAASAAAFKRNIAWADELAIWQDTALKSPRKARVYSNIGYALARSGRYNESMEYFMTAMRLEPDFFGSYNNIGNSLVETGRYEEAVPYFRKAIALRPRYARAYNSLGYAEAKASMLDEAVADLKKAVEIQPSYADAHSNLAMALAMKGMYEEAAVSARRALAIMPGSADLHNNLANVYLMSGRPDDAVAEYRRALAIDPANSSAKANIENALKGAAR